MEVSEPASKLLGVSKASFASAAEMHPLTGMEVGGVTPLALPPDLPLYIDGRVMDRDAVIVGGGGRDSKIRVSPEVFLRMGGVVVPDLARKRDDAVADELRSEPIENLPAGETVPLAET